MVLFVAARTDFPNARLHLPHIIQNSIQPLRGLSHSVIIFQKAQSHISMVLFVAARTDFPNAVSRTGL